MTSWYYPEATPARRWPDKDGDNVFTTFDDKNHYLMGGTGKYKGITGTVPYTVAKIHEAVGGRTAWIVNHKATWEIK